jgi:hypothetical protein
MVAVLGPFEALPCYIHTSTYIHVCMGETGHVCGRRIGRETEVVERNLLDCHFVQHKPHINLPGT